MVGQQIGSYRVVRKLGAGSMGEVYEVVHEQIGRRAAIKLLHRSMASDPDVVARFLNEARAVNIIQHPGVVCVSEVGQLPGGAPYLVMEYLLGESLGARLSRMGCQPGPATLRLVRQIASAVAAAHEKGIVHRDLKPDNVMLVPDPESTGGERIKVLDFGIAKIAAEHHAPGSSQPQTRTGMMIGTPSYMSPEQCRGAGRITDRADVYSLGVMLYLMLAGRLPFQATGVGEMIAMHIYAAPAHLSEHCPGVPAEVAALVHRMLAKEAGERPSMAQVAAELSRLDTLQVPLPATGPCPSALRMGTHQLMRPRRSLLWAGLTLLGLGGLWQSLHDRKSRPPMVQGTVERQQRSLTTEATEAGPKPK